MLRGSEFPLEELLRVGGTNGVFADNVLAELAAVLIVNGLICVREERAHACKRARIILRGDSVATAIPSVFNGRQDERVALLLEELLVELDHLVAWEDVVFVALLFYVDIILLKNCL